MSSEENGVIILKKDDRTVSVELSTKKIHPKYFKVINYTKKYTVHVPLDMKENPEKGDIVSIKECRPISKTKHKVLTKIVKKYNVNN